MHGLIERIGALFSGLSSPARHRAGEPNAAPDPLLPVLLDAAQDLAIIATDPQGRVTLFSRGAQRLLGSAEPEMLGRPLLDLLVADGVDNIDALGALAGGSSPLPWRLLRKDGTSPSLTLTLSALPGRAGEPAGLLLLGQDISDQVAARSELSGLKQQLAEHTQERSQALEETAAHLHSALAELQRAQEQLQQSERLASLGSQVAAVAHELNSPLGVCVTVASTLQEKTASFEQLIAGGSLRRSQLDAFVASQREGLQLLMRGLFRARGLVSNFKRVAVDTGVLQTRERFDLHRTIGELEGLTRVNLDKTPYKLVIDVPEGIFMEGFPSAIEQVFTNLVNNAVSHAFRERDHGLMRLSAMAAGNFVTIRFSDDGHGMSPEVQRRIFDPFFTTALGRGGTGLGMAICYELITVALGGNVEIWSELGQGTQFIITLPRAAPIGRGALGDVLPVTPPAQMTIN